MQRLGCKQLGLWLKPGVSETAPCLYWYIFTMSRVFWQPYKQCCDLNA